MRNEKQPNFLEIFDVNVCHSFDFVGPTLVKEAVQYCARWVRFPVNDFKHRMGSHSSVVRPLVRQWCTSVGVRWSLLPRSQILHVNTNDSQRSYILVCSAGITVFICFYTVKTNAKWKWVLGGLIVATEGWIRFRSTNCEIIRKIHTGLGQIRR